MKRNLFILFLLFIFFGLALSVHAQDVTPTMHPFQNRINPLTGGVVENPDQLLIPPVLIPIVRYPDKVRPTAGLSQAAWVFEFYDLGGISRPFALFYGGFPTATTGIEPYVGPIGSALLGVEDLRNHYGAYMVTAGNRSVVVKDGLYNVQYWYGDSGKDLFPKLPVSRLIGFSERWQKKMHAPDPVALKTEFSYGLPAAGLPIASLLIRYADENQVLWEYERESGLFLRSQNSIENREIVPDIDVLTNDRVAVQNLILLFHDTERITGDGVAFKPVLNFVEKNPAIIFRDGVRYDVYWTTKSGDYERETTRFRPIRFINADGTPFPLKPGQTWVHLIRVGNEVLEVDTPEGDGTRIGSGHWFVPYLEAK